MTIEFNETTCLDPSLSKAVTGEYDVAVTVTGLTSAINKLLELLKQLGDQQCETAQQSVERDNLAAGLISATGTRLSIVENIVSGMQDVIGLTPEQVAVITEAAGFLVDEDGTYTTLGNLVDRLASMQTNLEQFQTTFTAALASKADKSITDDHGARIAALEEAGVDLSGYATLDDLCNVSTRITNVVNTFFDKTKTALQGLADAVTEASNAVQAAVDNFAFKACEAVPVVTPSIPAGIGLVAPSGGNDAADAAPV